MFRQVPDEVCSWHRHDKKDPICANCEQRGGKIVFDLKKLGQMVVKEGIPNMPFFQLEKTQIEALGHCFLEAVDYDDPKAHVKKEEGKIPF